MLIVNPGEVSFGGVVIGNVSSIAIDRSATRRVIEWSDMGPHVVFVDCPEQRVNVSVVQELAQGDLGGLQLGSQGTLTFTTTQNRSAAGQTRISANAVLIGVTHDSKPRGFVRTLSFVAVSADGVSDPVTVSGA